MATAFFRISRSWRRISLSRSNCRMRSCSGVRRPWPGKPCSPSIEDFCFHRKRQLFPMPRSRSISAALLPLVSSSRSASSLNSRVYVLLDFSIASLRKSIIPRILLIFVSTFSGEDQTSYHPLWPTLPLLILLSESFYRNACYIISRAWLGGLSLLLLTVGLIIFGYLRYDYGLCLLTSWPY